MSRTHCHDICAVTECASSTAQLGRLGLPTSSRLKSPMSTVVSGD